MSVLFVIEEYEWNQTPVYNNMYWGFFYGKCGMILKVYAYLYLIFTQFHHKTPSVLLVYIFINKTSILK